ncbi:MAG: biotin--[acetyl-CoA-carboxylase] ligase, partial [Phycisphaerae bacterium]
TPTRLRHALDELRRRGCLLEQLPPGGTGGGSAWELRHVGLGCWQDLLEARARQTKRTLGRRVQVFRQTGSTNDVALEAAAALPSAQSHGLVVLADEQRAGRGRRGTPWQARPGQAVLMSVILRTPRHDTAHAETLTLRVGLACAEAIETLTGQEAEIKWPNDVLLGGRKVAGVLVEQPGPHAAIIGVGVNVAQAASDFPPELRAHATSLYQSMGAGRAVESNRAAATGGVGEQPRSRAAKTPRAEIPDRLLVIDTLLERLEAQCLPLKDGDATPDTSWLNQWKQRCHMLGREIRAQDGRHLRRGHVLDIDPLHGLVLRDPTGATHFLSARTTTLVRPAP